MSVRVRLTRVGSRKNPVWRVVVADQRSPRDGRVIEHIGRYNPQTEPSEVVLNEERLQHWIARGAQPTNTVKQLMKIHARTGGVAEAPRPAPPTSAPVEAAAPEAPADAPEAPADAPEATGEASPADAEASPDAGEAPSTEA